MLVCVCVLVCLCIFFPLHDSCVDVHCCDCDDVIVVLVALGCGLILSFTLYHAFFSASMQNEYEDAPRTKRIRTKQLPNLKKACKVELSTLVVRLRRIELKSNQNSISYLLGTPA